MLTYLFSCRPQTEYRQLFDEAALRCCSVSGEPFQKLKQRRLMLLATILHPPTRVVSYDIIMYSLHPIPKAHLTSEDAKLALG